MPSRRASAAVLVISPEGRRQSDFETAMALTALTARLNDTSKAFYRKEQTREDLLDCTGEELYKRILTGEIGDISIAFDATPRLVTLLAAYAMGVAAAPTLVSGKRQHLINELPPAEYQPPVFSMIFGFKGGATPLLLRGCVVNTFALSGRARGRVTGTANIKFAEGTPAAGFVLPACLNEEGLKFADCALQMNATDVADLRSFDFSFNNKLLTGDHAFTNEGILATRLERDDRRERTLTFAVLGDNSDPLYAEAEAGAEKALALRLGDASAESITFAAPRAEVVLDGGGLQKDGQVAETHIRVVATPMAHTAGQPLKATATNDQATAYLLTA